MADESDVLPKGIHEQILREQILTAPDFINSTAQQQPKAVILGGQPGAGKGGLVAQAKAELDQNAVTIDPDELRRYHPRIADFRRENPYEWSGRTHKDASSWADELRMAATAEKKNLIFDTTLSDGKWASETLIKGLQEQGYEVEVRAVASPKLESEHGVDERFTANTDRQGYGRHVPEGARDAIYGKLPVSLDTIHTNSNVPIRIFNREGIELYDSRTDARMPGQAMEEARNARLKDPAFTEHLREAWQKQVDWHRDLPEYVQAIPKSDPAVQAKLLEEHAKLRVSDVVASRMEGIATIDELVRPGAPPARVPVPEPEIPGLRRAGMTAGLAGLGVAATAYDASQTGERVGTLLAQDNLTAARSEALHFAARGAGGWAGGAATAAVVGTTGAGPVALVVADGYLFSAAADKAATLWDNRQIYAQTDKQGVSWEFNGSQWLRQEKADLQNDGADTQQKQGMFALPEKARELNYHASGEATEQALGKVQPSNPYVQPSSEADAAHLYARDWRHDPASGQWSRMIADEVDRNDRPVWTVDPASPERSAALNQQAAQVVDANIARGAAAIAATYQAAYQRNGWENFGPVPAAVQAALNPDSLQASDGRQYQRDTQGQWRHDGVAAEGNVPLELNATRERLQPALEQHAQAMAQMPARQTPTPQQQDQANTEATYAAYGVAPNAQTAGAIQLAVQKTREANGIDAATSSLALERDASGQYSVDSPIQHLSRGADGVVRVAATTSTAEIHQALGQVQSVRQGQPPSTGAPELRIDAQSPQERDAYEQALREANRQGVSTQEAQQVASFAATTVTAPRVDESQAPQAAIDAQRDRDVARTPDAPAAAAEMATPAPVVMPASISAQVREEPSQVAKPAKSKPEPVPQREPQETRTPEVAAPPTASAVQPKAEAVAPASASASAPSVGSPSSALTFREETPAQATVPTPPSFQEVEGLRLGDRGQEVEFLQYRLQQVNARGPNGQAVPQDGHYGPETEHAVRQFQQEQGLPATGIAGQDLDAALSQAQHARREALKPTEPASANAAVEQGSEQQARVGMPQNDAPSAVLLQATQQEAVRAPSPATATQSEMPAQIVLPERTSSSYTSSPSFGGAGGRSNPGMNDEDRVEQARPFQDVAQQAFPSNHRDYALFSAIQAQLPKGTSDEKTAEVLHAVKESGIERADELRKVTIQDDVAFVFGKTPGFHSETALNTPSPGINETLQKTEALDQQRAQEMVQFQREREEIDRNPTGPVMTLAAHSQQQAMSDASGGDGGGG
ncbi:zeta toxin family protein [Xanthomonas cannabis]|uniref:Peptidoglycan hydrolase-like protein with peptidoglycan-binding domain n=1 Tax=Xanthomonas cannabis TaxID=1885674 RepID=A0ABR6JRJ1_9XANT|nr:zeta toxin family protein [Xanthomonas cannabis]MBB4594857.1 peptidoglycan hydrolase-like protein with peptidoglycan-binding domain [Xanthomonas cannabis]MBB5523673.1 peptidoglycan hydrolase-like protein with peptidoglycan-binding domain [Xanthomonas cannabis]